MSEFFYDIVIEMIMTIMKIIQVKRSGHNCTQTNGQ